MDVREVGSRLRELRTAAGLTQRELADPDYTHAYVSTIESGKRQPSRAALEFFARRLGVTPDELMTGRPPDLLGRIDLELQNARRLVSSATLDEAEFAFRRIAEEARGYRLERVLARAQQGSALVAERRGNYEEALDLYAEAQRGLRYDPVTARAEAIAGEARCRQSLGDAHEAVYVLEKGLEDLARERLPDPGALVRLQAGLVTAYLGAGARSRAARAAEAALQLAPRTSNPERLAEMYLSVAEVFVGNERSEEARDALRRAADLFAEIDLKAEVARCYVTSGEVLLRAGEVAVARERLEEALGLYDQVDRPQERLRCVVSLAEVARREDRIDEARSLLAEALEAAEEDASALRASIHRAMARLDSASDAEAAERGFRLAIDMAERGNDPSEAAAARTELGDLLLERGDAGDAALEYRKAVINLERDA